MSLFFFISFFMAIRTENKSHPHVLPLHMIGESPLGLLTGMPVSLGRITLDTESTDTLTRSMEESRRWASTRRSFETMRFHAHRSGWRDIALELVDNAIATKEQDVDQAKRRYEQAAQELSDMQPRPRKRENFRQYKPAVDRHVVVGWRNIPEVNTDPKTLAEKRKSTASLLGWVTRRKKELAKYVEKRRRYEVENQTEIAKVDKALESMAKLSVLNDTQKRARLNGHVDELKQQRPDALDNATGYAGLATFRYKADSIAAPVVIHRVTEALKKRGLWGTILSNEYQEASRNFARNAVKESVADSPTKRVDIEKRVDDIMRLDARNYLRQVALAVDPGSSHAQKHARSIQMRHITPDITNEVMNIYRNVNAMQQAAEQKNAEHGAWVHLQWFTNPAYRKAMHAIYESPLVQKGGIIGIDKIDKLGSKRPFDGESNTPYLMPIVAIPRLKKEVLLNIPLPGGGGGKYTDMRVHTAIKRSIEESIASGKPASDYEIPEKTKSISWAEMNPAWDLDKITLSPNEVSYYLEIESKPVQTIEEYLKILKAKQIDRSAWHHKPKEAPYEPSFSDVWVGDVLHRTAELAMYGDKKTKAKLQAVLERVGAEDVNTGELIAHVTSLFKHVYDKLPWWEQGKKGYYPRVDDYMFRGMASHWVNEAKFKGVEHLRALTDQSPNAVREALNPARFNLTQRGLQGEIMEKRNEFETPKPRRSLLSWFKR